jgi:hypothetical protein
MGEPTWARERYKKTAHWTLARQGCAGTSGQTTTKSARRIGLEPSTENRLHQEGFLREANLPITIPEDSQRFHVGEYVTKFGGDYSFEGWVVAAYQKRSGVWRYVIEDSRGMNMIMNGSQIAKAHEPDLTDL